MHGQRCDRKRLCRAAPTAHAEEIYGTKSYLTVKQQWPLFVGEMPPKPPDVNRKITPGDKLFEASHSDGNAISLRILDSQPVEFWNADLSAPDGQKLKAGKTYRNVQRESFKDADRPGLDVSGTAPNGYGVACNTISGSFTVTQLKLGRLGWIQDLDISYVEKCHLPQYSGAVLTSTVTGRIVIHNGPAPGALKVSVTPQKVTTSADGWSSITFNVRCSRKAYLSLSGSLFQESPEQVGGTFNKASVSCTSKTRTRTLYADMNHKPLTPGATLKLTEGSVWIRDAAYYPFIEDYSQTFGGNAAIVAGDVTPPE